MRPKPRLSRTPEELPTRAEILAAFRGSMHTRTSRAVVEYIDGGEVRATFRKNLKEAGKAWSDRIVVRRSFQLADILTTLVHEGRHWLDIRSGAIPEFNPGGTTCLLAELTAWTDAAEFAATNGFITTTASRMFGMGSLEVAILLELRYRRAIRKKLSDREIRDVANEFERRKHAASDD